MCQQPHSSDVYLVMMWLCVCVCVLCVCVWCVLCVCVCVLCECVCGVCVWCVWCVCVCVCVRVSLTLTLVSLCKMGKRLSRRSAMRAGLLWAAELNATRNTRHILTRKRKRM